MRPITKAHWQDAVDAAEILARITTARILLFLELGRLFDLVDDAGEVDTQACMEVIEEARSRGIIPSEDIIWRFINDEDH